MIYVLAELDPDTGEQSRFVKIGWALVDGAIERVAGLQTGNPRMLVVIASCVGDVKLESSLHFRFSKWRVSLPGQKTRPNRWTEWFRVLPGSDLAQWIDENRVAKVDELCERINDRSRPQPEPEPEPEPSIKPRRKPSTYWPTTGPASNLNETERDDLSAACGETPYSRAQRGVWEWRGKVRPR